MATPDFRQNSPSTGAHSPELSMRADHTGSERSNERQFVGDHNDQASSEDMYTSPSTTPHTREACPFDVRTREEIAVPKADGAQEETRQEEPLIGELSPNTLGSAEGQELPKSAERAGTQEHIRVPPPLDNIAAAESVEATPKGNKPKPLSPPNSEPSPTKNLESSLAQENYSKDAHTLMTPSRSGTGSNNSSGENTSHVSQQVDLAPEQAMPEENSAVAEQPILAAPSIAYKHPEYPLEMIEAANILLQLNREEKAELAGKKDTASAPSDSGGVLSRSGRRNEPVGHTRDRQRSGNMYTGFSPAEFDAYIDQQSSDGDTEDDPDLINVLQSAEFPNNN
ncbi:hypothetical protein V8E51_006452 [Hyaloscypha variabilis]